MKKLLLALICALCLGQIGNAQFLQNIESTYKKYVSDIIKGEVEGGLKFTPPNIVNDKYVTCEQQAAAIDELEAASMFEEEVVFLNEETSITDSYVEIKISVPEGYKINKYIMVDFTYDANEPYFYFPFVSNRSILLRSNGKDVSFKLDYDVEFKDKESITDIPMEYIDQALDFTIRFSPKYFSFNKADNYNAEKQVNVQYKGKTVTLNVETYPVLIITTPSGVNMSYVLEPNWQNIYNDFKFVREGHKLEQKD